MWRSKCAALSIKINRGNNETHSKKPPTERTLSLFLSLYPSLSEISSKGAFLAQVNWVKIKIASLDSNFTWVSTWTCQNTSTCILIESWSIQLDNFDNFGYNLFYCWNDPFKCSIANTLCNNTSVLYFSLQNVSKLLPLWSPGSFGMDFTRRRGTKKGFLI